MKNLSEAMLVKARSGDPEAFMEVFYQYRPIMLVYKKKYTIKDLEYEDWEQEAKMICYTSLKTYAYGHGLTFGGYFKMNFERHIFSLLRKQSAKKRENGVKNRSYEQMVQHNQLLVSEEDQRATLSLEQVIVRDTMQNFTLHLSEFEQQAYYGHLLGATLTQIARVQQTTPDKSKRALERVQRKMHQYLNT